MRHRSQLNAVYVAVSTLALIAATVAGSPAVAAAPTSSIPWRACDDKALDGFQCASFPVPLDWADPSGPVITLRMARHRSSGGSAQRIGSLFFNPGGPGQSGVAILPSLWSILPERVRQRFDLVTWDPRGMGLSTAIADCADATYALPAVGPVDWAAVESSLRATTAEANAACQAANAVLANVIGTNQVVDDLDAMRAAVGDRRLTYWGASYGTRIGYTYALRYPDRVRAILLDGSVNPNGSVADFVTGYSTAAESGLGFFFQLYPQASRHYQRALAALERAPLTLADGSTFTRWDLKSLLVMFAGKEWSPSGTYADLAEMLAVVDTAVTGSGAKARAARTAMIDMPHDPVAYGLTGAPAMVNCIDYADRPPTGEQAQVAARARAIAPITGWFNGLGLIMQCEGLNLTPDPVPVSFGTNTTVPMLLVGSTRDANTPYAWTVDMARAFRASRTVTYVGSKHVSYAAAQSACVDEVVNDWLIRRVLPTRDVTCANAYAR